MLPVPFASWLAISPRGILEMRVVLGGGEEASLECFLVGPDGTSTTEGLFQVGEYLEEGHPRLYLWRRSAGA